SGRGERAERGERTERGERADRPDSARRADRSDRDAGRERPSAEAVATHDAAAAAGQDAEDLMVAPGASEEAVADAGDESRAGRSRRRRGRRGGAHRDASRAGAIENGEGEISDEPRETAEDVAGPDESTTAAEIAAADDDVVQAAVETTPPAS